MGGRSGRRREEQGEEWISREEGAYKLNVERPTPNFERHREEEGGAGIGMDEQGIAGIRRKRNIQWKDNLEIGGWELVIGNSQGAEAGEENEWTSNIQQPNNQCPNVQPAFAKAMAGRELNFQRQGQDDCRQDNYPEIIGMQAKERN